MNCLPLQSHPELWHLMWSVHALQLERDICWTCPVHMSYSHWTSCMLHFQAYLSYMPCVWHSCMQIVQYFVLQIAQHHIGLACCRISMSTSRVCKGPSACWPSAKEAANTMQPQVGMPSSATAAALSLPRPLLIHGHCHPSCFESFCCFSVSSTTSCSTCLCAGLYREGDWLLFGAETTGLPEEVCLMPMPLT